MDKSDRLEVLRAEAEQAKNRYERVVSVQAWLADRLEEIPTETANRVCWGWFVCIFLLTVVPIIFLPLFQTADDDSYFITVAICLILSWLGIFLTIVSPTSWKLCGWFETILRYIPQQVAFAFAAWRKEGIGQWLEARSIDPYFVNYVVTGIVAVALSTIWLSQFKLSDEVIEGGAKSISDRKKLAAAWKWSKDEAVAGDRRKADMSLDWAFAIFAALSFNAFSIVGSLDYPLYWIVFLAILILTSNWIWRRQLWKWRRTNRAHNYGLGDMSAWGLVVVGAGILFGLQGGLAALAEHPPLVEWIKEGTGGDQLGFEELGGGFTRKDLIVFGFQLFIVVLTTSLPVAAALWYRRSLSAVFRAEGFAYALNGNPFLEVDQKRCTFSPLDAKAPWGGIYRVYIVYRRKS